MRIHRRTLLKGAAVAALGVAAPAVLRAQATPFKLGLLTVKTGPLAQGGIQMEQGTLTFLKERNFTIGGRKVEFVSADTARKFLESTGARFLAGYQKEIPWTESMLVDSLFLSYLLGGTMKWVRTKHGERVPPLRQLGTFEITHTERMQKVAAMLYRDFPLAHDITFSVFTLDRQRGRKPRLVNSFEESRKSVDRARRQVRDL